MQVAVIGAGAIGGWVAAKLSLAGEQVMALTSRGALGEIMVCEKEQTRTARLTRFTGAADLIVLAVKATALSRSAKHATTLVGAKTIIVPMLNGVPWWFVPGTQLKSVDPDANLEASFPLRQLIGCVVHASCSRLDEKVIVEHADKLIIGTPDGEASDELRRVFDLFDNAGLGPQITENVRRAIWYKLWGNATINPLSALTRVTCDKILADPACRRWMLDAMGELAEIGAAVGCPILESGEDRMAVTARLGAFKTSMLQDVEAGRPIELEALVGAPREIARAHRIETPALDQLYGVTRLLTEGLGLKARE